MFSVVLLLMQMDELKQHLAALDAIRAETQITIEATIAKDIDRYMEGVPRDLRILEDDGSVTD
jgi:hypothetical protein